jgi:creatinine amidohydrolase
MFFSHLGNETKLDQAAAYARRARIGGQMSPDKYDHVRLEYLLPFQIRRIMVERPVAYLPLGTIEWHSEHLPVGLDALTAHGICLRAAAAGGGLVYPPLYYGTGGGHGGYPWTVMMPGADEIEAQLNFTLSRMETLGVKRAVLFSGHFADTQLEMIDRVAADWNAGNSSLKAAASAVNRIPGTDFAPDHAGLFETTLLYGLHPDLVQEDRLPQKQDGEAEVDPFGAQRHAPDHPLWGIFGPDPRGFDGAKAQLLVDAIVAHLVRLAAQ